MDWNLQKTLSKDIFKQTQKSINISMSIRKRIAGRTVLKTTENDIDIDFLSGWDAFLSDLKHLKTNDIYRANLSFSIHIFNFYQLFV